MSRHRTLLHDTSLRLLFFLQLHLFCQFLCRAASEQAEVQHAHAQRWRLVAYVFGVVVRVGQRFGQRMRLAEMSRDDLHCLFVRSQALLVLPGHTNTSRVNEQASVEAARSALT